MPVCSKYIVLRKVSFSLDIGFSFLICLIQRSPPLYLDFGRKWFGCGEEE